MRPLSDGERDLLWERSQDEAADFRADVEQALVRWTTREYGDPDPDIEWIGRDDVGARFHITVRAGDERTLVVRYDWREETIVEESAR